MIHSTKVAKRYAKALLDYAIENQKEELLFGEISSVVEVIHENPDLKALLHSPIVKTEVKQRVLQEIFAEHISELQVLFTILFQNKRISDLYAIAREFVEQYNEYKEKIVIHLTTAVEASDRLKKEFVAKAVALSGKRNISLENKIDPSIIGGFILRINDLQYNASISYKLQAIQEQFKENVF